MKKKLLTLITMIMFLLFGCNDRRHELPTRTETNVSVKSFVMNAEDFDLASVIARLKKGDLSNAEALEKFINTTPGINNIDIDKDGNVDNVSVTEEKSSDGQMVMAINAFPKKGESIAVAEVSFTRNTTTGTVEVSGAYPESVNGYQDHYYHSTLTGSVVGDMMFYHWLFSPRSLYVSPYHGGLYYGVAPHHTMSRSQVTKTRTTYRTQHSVSPVKKQPRPKSYAPKSAAVKKSVAKQQQRSNKLSDRAGTTKQFKDRGTAKAKPKARNFGAKKSVPRSTPRKSSSGFFGGSRSSSRGFSRRKSSAKFKHDVDYLTRNELDDIAERFYEIPLATWQYNDDIPEGDGRERMGFIIEDVPGEQHIIEKNGEEVDLYGYTSMVGATVQSLHLEINALKKQIEQTQRECHR